MTLVSVVVPTYDRAGPVTRAVASVLAQSHQGLECIVVDDGSTDDTADRLAAIKDPRLRVLSQDNQGVSAARNAGLAMAQGELLALLDSDDLWEPDKLALQVAHMQERGLEFCQTDEAWVRNGKRVNPGRRHRKGPGDPADGRLFLRSLDLCLISPSAVAFSRGFWDTVGPFDTGMPACEDYDLWLRALLRYRLGFVDQTLVVKHGGNPDQLSGMPGLDLYRCRSLVRILQDSLLPEAFRPRVLRHLEAKARVYVGGLSRRGRTQEAERIWNLVCRALAGESISPEDMC